MRRIGVIMRRIGVIMRRIGVEMVNMRRIGVIMRRIGVEMVNMRRIGVEIVIFYWLVMMIYSLSRRDFRVCLAYSPP